MARATITLPGPVDVRRTLARMRVLGSDPTRIRVGDTRWVAFHTADGPASIGYRQVGDDRVEVEAHGPGAARAIEAAPDHLGARDRPEDFTTDDPIVAPLLKRFVGIRIGRTGRVLDQLVPTILGQKVTGKGAGRSWRELLRRVSEPAPGGVEGLWLPPTAAQLATLAYYDFHPLGVERKRAMTILGAVRRAKTIEKLADAPRDAAYARLEAFEGVGPWTSAIVIGAAQGDADAVAVGDYHLCHMVTHAFTGEDRGTDARMLELLEPFRPHRARVMSLLAAAGYAAPRFGPRMPVRDIRGQ